MQGVLFLVVSSLISCEAGPLSSAKSTHVFYHALEGGVIGGVVGQLNRETATTSDTSLRNAAAGAVLGATLGLIGQNVGVGHAEENGDILNTQETGMQPVLGTSPSDLDVKGLAQDSVLTCLTNFKQSIASCEYAVPIFAKHQTFLMELYGYAFKSTQAKNDLLFSPHPELGTSRIMQKLNIEAKALTAYECSPAGECATMAGHVVFENEQIELGRSRSCVSDLPASSFRSALKELADSLLEIRPQSHLHSSDPQVAAAVAICTQLAQGVDGCEDCRDPGYYSIPTESLLTARTRDLEEDTPPDESVAAIASLEEETVEAKCLSALKRLSLEAIHTFTNEVVKIGDGRLGDCEKYISDVVKARRQKFLNTLADRLAAATGAAKIRIQRQINEVSLGSKTAAVAFQLDPTNFDLIRTVVKLQGDSPRPELSTLITYSPTFPTDFKGLVHNRGRFQRSAPRALASEYAEGLVLTELYSANANAYTFTTLMYTLADPGPYSQQALIHFVDHGTNLRLFYSHDDPEEACYAALLAKKTSTGEWNTIQQFTDMAFQNCEIACSEFAMTKTKDDIRAAAAKIAQLESYRSTPDLVRMIASKKAKLARLEDPAYSRSCSVGFRVDAHGNLIGTAVYSLSGEPLTNLQTPYSNHAIPARRFTDVGLTHTGRPRGSGVRKFGLCSEDHVLESMKTSAGNFNFHVLMWTVANPCLYTLQAMLHYVEQGTSLSIFYKYDMPENGGSILETSARVGTEISVAD